MPYIPHTPTDISEMLAALNLQEISSLFDEIPPSISKEGLLDLPDGLNESAVSRLMQERAPQLLPGGNFIGAGAYEHHIPAAVWEIASRGEYLTAYTPYQAEASQGTLQLLYEYQTMISQLMNTDISNASLYDGASSMAEAVLMAMRIKPIAKGRVLVPKTLHPAYRQVLNTVLKSQDIQLENLDYDHSSGYISPDQLNQIDGRDLMAVLIPQPNFFGVLEEVDALTDFAHQHGGLAIAVVNPLAMALLKEPGSWGKRGADIVCGEGQPLGVPLASGGPYFGFISCRKEFVRQMPGRIVGRTHDASGRTGFTLTLQTREQHIRRAKATSNICTNQGLLVTAATIYMSLLGPRGLQSVAATCHSQAKQFRQALAGDGVVQAIFNRPFFHEFVIRLPFAVDKALAALKERGILGGYSLKEEYPELGECLLVCVTETKTLQDLVRYQQYLSQISLA